MKVVVLDSERYLVEEVTEGQLVDAMSINGMLGTALTKQVVSQYTQRQALDELEVVDFNATTSLKSRELSPEEEMYFSIAEFCMISAESIAIQKVINKCFVELFEKN